MARFVEAAVDPSPTGVPVLISINPQRTNQAVAAVEVSSHVPATPAALPPEEVAQWLFSS
jgi:hypothetical protein